MTQALGIDFTGFVKFPEDKLANSKPVLYQRYNNIFGVDANEYPAKRAAITKVRVGYPVDGYSTNPVNCYVDIYLDYEPREGYTDQVAFNMAYSGKAASHNTSAIITETPAEDFGIYGEELQYYEFEVKVGPDIYTQGEIEANQFTGNVKAQEINSNKIYANEVIKTSIEEAINGPLGYNIPEDGLNNLVISSPTIQTLEYSFYRKYNMLQLNNGVKFSTSRTGEPIPGLVKVSGNISHSLMESGAIHVLGGTATSNATLGMMVNNFTNTFIPAGVYKTNVYNLTHTVNGTVFPDEEGKIIFDVDGYISQVSAARFMKDTTYEEGYLIPYLIPYDSNIEYNYDSSNDIIRIVDNGATTEITNFKEFYCPKGIATLEIGENESKIDFENKVQTNILSGSILSSYLENQKGTNRFGYLYLNKGSGCNHQLYVNKYDLFSKIEVDSELSSTSTNSVQNKAISKVLENCIKLDYDDYDKPIVEILPGITCHYNGENSYITVEHMYGTATIIGNSIKIQGAYLDEPSSYFNITLQEAGVQSTSIEASEDVKQAFKDWLGI